MQTHEVFVLVTGETEKDCCNKEAPVLDWIQTFYCEAIIKLKENSLRFKNISASAVLFKNEINNQHNSALFNINSSFIYWYKIYSCVVFFKNSIRYTITNLPIFLSVHCSPTDTQ
jgi:hypothetical protein